MSYQTFLATRGYRRATVERTTKHTGDLILHRVDQPAERVAGKDKVVAIRGRG
jgi:hypothetical protein